MTTLLEVEQAEEGIAGNGSTSKWATYRMWHQVKNAVADHGSSAEWLAEWKPTDVTFRARSQSEAQKKADKFWRDAEFGSGSMICILADEQL